MQTNKLALWNILVFRITSSSWFSDEVLSHLLGGASAKEGVSVCTSAMAELLPKETLTKLYSLNTKTSILFF